MVYNPNAKVEPKTKPIFKVIKTNSRKSSFSGGSLGESKYLADIERQADQMNLFSPGDFTMSSAVLESQRYHNNETSAFGLPGFNVPHGHAFPQSY